MVRDDARPTLRPYQRAAIDAVLTARRRGVRRMVVCLPTGAGKTVIFSELARLARRPVLVLAHRRELITQAHDKLCRALGDEGAVGVEQGDTTASPHARVVVASIRSLRPERLARLIADRPASSERTTAGGSSGMGGFGLVVYDECHHAAAADNKRVLRALGAFDPDWSGTLLGLTATTARGDGRGLDEVFQEIVYTRSIGRMVSDGYLAPLRGYRIATAADLRGVSLTRGDLQLDELAEAIDIQERNALVARSIQELARDRRTIAFCVTVAHARNLARALNTIGVPAGIVYGQMKPEARRRTLADFRAGRLSAVTNVGVLTEGFDDPGVSCIAMARPTRSSGLYAQCVGRGTRPAPGKPDCVVLDFADLGDLSLVTLPSLAGLPRDLDLAGTHLDRAEHALSAIWQRFPGFEIPPGEITLGEIQRRAAAFDPLQMRPDPEISAISPNGWESLGSRGLALHVCWSRRDARAGTLTEILVLDQGGPGQGGRGRGKRWRVTVADREVARFSRIAEAVEAVDHEVRRRGRQAAGSARPGAPWRREAVPDQLSDALSALNPSRLACSHGEALRLLTWAAYGPGHA